MPTHKQPPAKEDKLPEGQAKPADSASESKKIAAQPASGLAGLLGFSIPSVMPYLQRYLFLEMRQPKDVAKRHLKGIKKRQKKLLRLIEIQNYIIAILLVVILLLEPVLRPIYHYMAVRPDQAKMSLASMMVPNLTDQTITSWSATAITDILTFGFGDVDRRIISQRSRFTEDGWISFIKGFFERNVKQAFQGRQLVLTTVPADLPVIVHKGPDEDGRYKWVVEMPVIMKYSTNNLASSSARSVVRLILSRVPPSQSKSGVGIEKWLLK